MANHPTRQLNLFDTVCIIVGVVVGSGIYETSHVVAGSAGSAFAALGVWAGCGCITLVAAFCYAELSTSFPRDGGDFIYLNEAYDVRLGNLFAWCEFWIIRPGNIGMMAFVFANYTRAVVPLNLSADWPQLDSIVYACAAVFVLTLLNLCGVRAGKITQNSLSVLKVAGLLGVTGLLWMLSGGQASQAAEAPPRTDLRLAILMAMFAYGGWAEMAMVAAEVKNPRRNLLYALVLGAIAITVLYVAVNSAFFYALGYDGVRNSHAVATDAMQRYWPQGGGVAVSLLVGISCLGAANATLMTGSRIIYAVGEVNPQLKALGRWSQRFDAPVAALVSQGMMTVVLILALGFNDRGGFEELLIFTTPVYWVFAMLVAFGLFRLRRREPDQPPFRAPLYPLTPLIFVGLCGFMLYSSVTYAIDNRSRAALASLVVVALGVVFAIFVHGPAKEFEQAKKQ